MQGSFYPLQLSLIAIKAQKRVPAEHIVASGIDVAVALGGGGAGEEVEADLQEGDDGQPHQLVADIRPALALEPVGLAPQEVGREEDRAV